MTIQNNKQNTLPRPKQEFINALRPFRRIGWMNTFIKKVRHPQTTMPKGKNANTEKFILGLSICFCLFKKHHSTLMKYGKPLKDYTNQHAVRVPLAQAPLVKNKLIELMTRLSK